MKLIIELCILLVFFLAYHFLGIYPAIGVALALYTLQIAVQYLCRKPVTRLELMTYISVMLLGGLSLFFQNELFFKWKPSVIYFLCAGGIAITRLWTQTPALQKVIGHTIELPTRIWTQLDYAWGGFFMALAGLNLVIAYQFSTDLWVYFKMFGTMGLLVVFMGAQAWWLSPYLKERGSK